MVGCDHSRVSHRLNHPTEFFAHPTQVNYLKLTEQYGDSVLASLRENGQLSLKRVNSKAKEALGDGVWSPDLKIKVRVCGFWGGGL